MKLSEAIRKVIDLGRKIEQYYDTELPKYHPNYPLVTLEEPEPPPPPQEKELRDLLATLSHEMTCQLLLLANLGRMYFGTEELASRFEELHGAYSQSEAARDLMAVAPLADILLDALAELHKHKINVDRLSLKKVASRKR